MKNLFFIFLYECFSHFNVQQLPSNLSHFALFSQANLKITLKTQIFEKSISFDFIELRILRCVLHCSIFFGARLENPKINKRGVLITAGEGGLNFFQKK